MKRGIRVYLARDKLHTEYKIFARKPEYDKYFETWRGRCIQGFCEFEFLRVTGYKLKPGECKRVRIVVEEV